MSPDQKRIAELERKLAELTRWTEQFQSAVQVDAQIARTIQTLSGVGTLANLSDVTLIAPSNGQVLKYNGTEWVNGTDNT